MSGKFLLWFGAVVLLGTILVCASIGLPATTDRTPPLRPNAADLSLSVFEANSSDPLRWFHGHTATQVERDAVESGLTGIAMPRVIRWARTQPACASSLGYLFTNYSKITSKLGPLYEAQSMKNGTWEVTVSGRHYHFEHYNERRVRDCVLSNATARALCGKTITPDLATMIGVHVVNGQCATGNGVVVFPPSEPFDSARGVLGIVDTKHPAPIPNPTQASLLASAVSAHNALDPTTGLKRLATETSATSEAQHHFLRSKDFMSDIDPAWSVTDQARWHTLQNLFMTRWAAEIVTGDWFAARQADTDHQLAHICLALKDDRLLVLFSCPAGLGKTGSMDLCPITTCAEALLHAH